MADKKTDEKPDPRASLAFKKEDLKHLKVKTDLRGGALALAAGPCSGCHCSVIAA